MVVAVAWLVVALAIAAVAYAKGGRRYAARGVLLGVVGAAAILLVSRLIL